MHPHPPSAALACPPCSYVRLDRAGEPPEGMDPKVADALRRVQDAMSEAEASMQRLHSLPSARLPSVWDRALGALRPVAQFAALAAACAAIHSLGAAARALGSLAVGLGVAWYGLRRSSLSPSGAAAVSGGPLQPAWCCSLRGAAGSLRAALVRRRGCSPSMWPCCRGSLRHACLCRWLWLSCGPALQSCLKALRPVLPVQAAVLGGATLWASFRSGLLLLTFFFTSSKITQAGGPARAACPARLPPRPAIDLLLPLAAAVGCLRTFHWVEPLMPRHPELKPPHRFPPPSHWQLGEELKDVEEDHKKGGQRDWRQARPPLRLCALRGAPQAPRHAAARQPGFAPSAAQRGHGMPASPVPACSACRAWHPQRLASLPSRPPGVNSMLGRLTVVRSMFDSGRACTGSYRPTRCGLRALQVFCNALVPTCLALAAAYYSGGGADLALGEAAPLAAAAAGSAGPVPLARLLTGLHAAFLGYYACCCGDTWSSELGQLRWAVPGPAGTAQVGSARSSWLHGARLHAAGCVSERCRCPPGMHASAHPPDGCCSAAAFPALLPSPSALGTARTAHTPPRPRPAAPSSRG